MGLNRLTLRSDAGGYEWTTFARDSFRAYDYATDRPMSFCVGRRACACVVLAGEVEFEMGPTRRAFRVREGEAYVVAPGTPYFFRMTAGTRVGVVDLFDYVPPGPGIAVLPAAALARAHEAAFEGAVAERSPRRLEAAHRAARALGERLGEDSFLRMDAAHNTALLLRVKECLDRAENEAVSLGGLAKRFGIDASYLSREFHDAFGAPPSHYLFLLRAEDFLVKTMFSDRPFGRTAEEVGFADYATFFKRFRRQFGRSPSRLVERTGRRSEPPSV